MQSQICGKTENIKPKQMFQRLPMPLVQVKAIIHLNTYLMKSYKLYILCIKKNKLLKEVYKNIMNSIKL